MQEVHVIKSSGDKARFDAERIRSSVIRAGASPLQAEDVVRDVVAKMHPDISTRELYFLVEKSLDRIAGRAISCRYGLRDALLKLGPAGFLFEKYLVALFAAEGYQTELPEEMEGGCVRHEVDVLARKDGKAYGIEAKFRNRVDDIVRLKDVLASYARFLDLLDGAALQRCPKLAEFWIVTNGHFSDRALQFARCKGMRLIGWKYPEGRNLAMIIDRKGLYPLSILPGLSDKELVLFANMDIVLCKDLGRTEAQRIAHRTGISQARIEELIDLASEIDQSHSALHVH